MKVLVCGSRKHALQTRAIYLINAHVLGSRSNLLKKFKKKGIIHSLNKMTVYICNSFQEKGHTG